jgi:hypothetical protein
MNLLKDIKSWDETFWGCIIWGRIIWGRIIWGPIIAAVSIFQLEWD